MNNEMCYCGQQSAQIEVKQGICFANSERCGYNYFCNTCRLPKHREHLAECKSLEEMEYMLKIILDSLTKDLEEFNAFLKQLKKRKVLNDSWVLQIKKAKKILDEEYLETSENNVQQRFQDPAQTQKVLRYYEDEINTMKDLFKQQGQQSLETFEIFREQTICTPLIKKLFRKFEEYKQFNLKEKLEQEIINAEQKEIQYYEEKLQSINTINSLGHFKLALKPLRKLRKSFKNEQLDKLYGQQLIKCRKYDEAEQFYQDKLEKNPRFFWPKEGRIDCLIEMGQSTQALSYIDSLLRNRQSNIILLNKKLLIQQQLGINTESTEDRIQRRQRNRRNN